MPEWTAIISNLGFPIAVACAFFWWMVKEQRELRAVIENNTKVVVQVLEHLREKGKAEVNEE